MGKYKSLNFHQSMNKNMIIKFIKHSDEYKELNERSIALNLDSFTFNFWIKREVYSLYVMASSSEDISFILFLSLQLFDTQEKIHISELNSPIVILNNGYKFKNSLLGGLDIDTDVICEGKIFNGLTFKRIDCQFYYLVYKDLPSDLDKNTIKTWKDSLVKENYINLFQNCTFLNLRKLYFSMDGTSEDIDNTIKNNIVIKNISLVSTNSFFSEVYENKQDILGYLGSNIDYLSISDKVFLAILSVRNPSATSESYYSESKEIVENLKKYNICMEVCFVPAIVLDDKYKNLISSLSDDKIMVRVH